MLKRLRVALVVLVALATAGFVVGTSIERHDRAHESAAQRAAERPAGEGGHGEARETAQQHASETAAASYAEAHPELLPLGIDIEAVPFVVLAALASIGLAAIAWTRAAWMSGLLVLIAAMALFAALDVREIFHQADEQRTGLETLAAAVAALHLASAAVAIALARRAGQPQAPAASTAA